jgi:hypothetical protein
MPDVLGQPTPTLDDTSEDWRDMKPSDPTAVAKRFAAVLARSIERADREREAQLARIRAKRMDDEPADLFPPSVDELSFDAFSLTGLDRDIARLVGSRTDTP